MTSREEEIKPCPFCGKQPDLSDPDTLYPSGTLWRWEPKFKMRVYFHQNDRQFSDGACYTLHCTRQAGGCGAEMHADSREETISAWNSRVVPARVRVIAFGCTRETKGEKCCTHWCGQSYCVVPIAAQGDPS